MLSPFNISNQFSVAESSLNLHNEISLTTCEHDVTVQSRHSTFKCEQTAAHLHV